METNLVKGGVSQFKNIHHADNLARIAHDRQIEIVAICTSLAFR
jgi:hypothetical protein